MTSPRVAYMYACVSARVCNKGESTLLRIFANSLITRTLYTCVFIFIFSMWDFVSCFKCACDVAALGASDARVAYESLIFTYGGGYAAQSYS